MSPCSPFPSICTSIYSKIPGKALELWTERQLVPCLQKAHRLLEKTAEFIAGLRNSNDTIHIRKKFLMVTSVLFLKYFN